MEAVGCVWWMKNIIIFVLLCLGFFSHLLMLFTFSALISNIYWCGIVSHQQILMVWHVTPAKIIGAANATPMQYRSCTDQGIFVQVHWTLKKALLFWGFFRPQLILQKSNG